VQSSFLLNDMMNHDFIYFAGMCLALLMIKLMLITVLKKYEVLTCKKTPIPLVLDRKALMTVPSKNIMLNIRKIKDINVK